MLAANNRQLQVAVAITMVLFCQAMMEVAILVSSCISSLDLTLNSELIELLQEALLPPKASLAMVVASL